MKIHSTTCVHTTICDFSSKMGGTCKIVQSGQMCFTSTPGDVLPTCGKQGRYRRVSPSRARTREGTVQLRSLQPRVTHNERVNHNTSRFIPKRTKRGTTCNHKNGMYKGQISTKGIIVHGARVRASHAGKHARRRSCNTAAQKKQYPSAPSAAYGTPANNVSSMEMSCQKRCITRHRFGICQCLGHCPAMDNIPHRAGLPQSKQSDAPKCSKQQKVRRHGNPLVKYEMV